jgi:hypothetical protein
MNRSKIINPINEIRIESAWAYGWNILQKICTVYAVSTYNIALMEPRVVIASSREEYTPE